jgi:hypothetical protein
VIFVMFIISVRGAHCGYSPWVPKNVAMPLNMPTTQLVPDCEIISCILRSDIYDGKCVNKKGYKKCHS